MPADSRLAATHRLPTLPTSKKTDPTRPLSHFGRFCQNTPGQLDTPSVPVPEPIRSLGFSPGKSPTTAPKNAGVLEVNGTTSAG